VVFKSPPDFAMFNFKQMLFHNDGGDRSTMTAWHESEDAIFDGLIGMNNSVVLDPKNLFCNDDGCRPIIDNVLMYVDDNHLSADGAMYVSHLLRSAL
jgi:hypothetical protein